MKTVYISALAFSLLLISCGDTVQMETEVKTDVEVIVNEVENDSTNNYFATIDIEGMTCAMGCAKTIEDKLKAMDGVAACEVDFDNKIASVEFDHNKTNEEKFISEITSIHDGQYQVTKVIVEKPVAKHTEEVAH